MALQIYHDNVDINKQTNKNINQYIKADLLLTYITDLVYYTNFHWFFNPECQHIFGKQTGYIFQSPQNDTNMDDKTLRFI